ncbi:hypothetical protein QA601_15025 [Chitinispirillales bacterium ANBcel5]|uniref:hypothetical protein n=1 Tax=Cellulosispirillum alkaliphilum TaxID=3039283 RepID=UPI002A56D0D1|nr:hypothetical protein [Chitinispirillales bacterium ANBcel5]
MKQRKMKIEIFSSFEEEAKSEYQRRSQQSPQERIVEFSILQERCWGEKWTNQKIEPVVSYEEVAWYP